LWPWNDTSAADPGARGDIAGGGSLEPAFAKQLFRRRKYRFTGLLRAL